MRTMRFLALVCLSVVSNVEANLQTITENNWREILTGEWMVEL